MNTDDLFYKIGVLTMENELLRRTLTDRENILQKVTAELIELRAVKPDNDADLRKVAEENQE